ncbi:hypothetical protein ES705_14197 [subsurface metagenome]
MNVAIRINGRAPAWPVLLENEHPFYAPYSPGSLASVSYSILAYEESVPENKLWETVVDAGHNTVPSLIQHGNRIPETILLTHAHNDHVLGVDWIVQSYYFKHRKSKKYPLYSTKEVWYSFIQLFPYLQDIIAHTELLPGRKTLIKETGNMFVTAFPVYHGESARGASMLFFEGEGLQPAIISGDLLCPLLRKKDYQTLNRARVMFVDTNNRYPDPLSNHTSFTSRLPGKKEKADKLTMWFNSTSLKRLVDPHICSNCHTSIRHYFDEFMTDWKQVSDVPHTILELNKLLKIPEVYLVHYFGYYDRINYSEDLMNTHMLEKWANNCAKEMNMYEEIFKVPQVGELINL